MAVFQKSDEESFWTCQELASWFCSKYHQDMRSISSCTLRFAIRRYGLNRRIADFLKPLIAEHIAARLAFAQAHGDCTVEQWKKVIFTDENGVCGNRIVRKWVSRLGNSKHEDWYRGQETPRSARVNFYAYVTSQGIGNVAIFLLTLMHHPSRKPFSKLGLVSPCVPIICPVRRLFFMIVFL